MVKRLFLLGLLLAGLSALAPATSSASAIREFEASPSTTQAGGHPNVTIRFRVDYDNEPEIDDNCTCNNIRNADIELPAGLIGNPHATPQCNAADFARELCPVDSQIGTAEPLVQFGREGTLGHNDGSGGSPFYNVVPKPTQAGLLAWRTPLFNTPVYTVISARTGGDYGLNAFTDGIEQSLPVIEFAARLWGVPADPSHDAERGVHQPSNSPRTPFLSNPTTCAEPLESHMTELGYDDEVHVKDAPWPQTTGCDQLAFNPSLSARPTTTAPDAPSGLEVDLSVPQVVSADAPSPSEIRGTDLILPKGFSISPAAADGKVSCSDEEANFGTELEAHCPGFSRIGAVEINSAALPAPIPGSMYLGTPLPGNRYRIYLTGNGFATHVKLSGFAELNSADGQVVIRFDDLPQAPLTEFNLHVFGAERGIMATPTQCGTYMTEAVFTPWDEALAQQTSKQFFNIEESEGRTCPPAERPFNPGFEGSSVSNAAGEHTPFTINLTRPDGDQNLKDLTIKPPRGLLGTLAGIPYCPESTLNAVSTLGYSGIIEQLSPGCPTASQVGTSDAGAGPGTHPVHLPGKVYLAGPYRGAPLSLAVVTPAVSGPYDLGNVVVRAALFVDPETAQVTALSDPLPQIFEGIPLRLRSLFVSLDRPDFTLNPTNCSPLSVDATIGGDQGASITRSAPFQVSNCSIMPFAPRLSLSLSGSTHRTGNPSIKATLKANPGEANIAATTVTMPHTLFLDNSHLNAPCTRVQFNANACPAASILGTARAVSPLLDKPLEGPVYLKVSNHKLPDMVAALHGQIDFNLAAHIDSVKQRLRARFETVPDVPVTEFSLNLFGKKRGLVENSEEVCASARTASVRFNSQSGRSVKQNVSIKTPCGGDARKKRAKRHGEGRNR